MSTQPGWYKDPHNSNLLRYWNGYNWTEHTAPAFTPPVTPSPPPPLQQDYAQPVSQPKHSHPEYQSENVNTGQPYYAYHNAENFNTSTQTPNTHTQNTSYYYPTVKKNSTATIVLSILVGILTVLIITVTSIASLMLLTPSSNNGDPAPPTQTEEGYIPDSGQEFPPVNFDDGVRLPAEGAKSWTVPEYWETVSTVNGATSYKTRTCEVKIFNTPVTGEIPADVTSDEMLSALLLQETTKVSAATILADANSFHMHYKNTEDAIILLAAPWELNLEQVVDGVSTVKTIYGWDTVQASVANKNAFGVQAGCENTTDLEAVMNELHSEGNVTF